MYAKEESLSIFQGACKYVIPESSSLYVWNKNSLEEFWDKLISKKEKVFLGNACFKSRCETLDTLILGGQDVLITLSILIKCLLSHYSKNEEKICNILKERIFQKSLVLKEDTLTAKASPRIEILNSDKAAYEAVLYDSVDEKSIHPIICAYKYFQDNIKGATPDEINYIIEKVTDNQCNLLFVFFLQADDDKELYLNVLSGSQ